MTPAEYADSSAAPDSEQAVLCKTVTLRGGSATYPTIAGPRIGGNLAGLPNIPVAMDRRRWLLIPLLALAVTGCGTVAAPGIAVPAVRIAAPALSEPVSPYTVISGEGWQGVLLDARLDWIQLPDGTVVEEGVTSFVPQEADARRFEQQAPAILAGYTKPGDDDTPKNLDGYVRQYTGVAGDGARQLVVAGICGRAASDMDWQRGWYHVADGGTCFWDATMDLETAEVLRFSFHGSA